MGCNHSEFDSWCDSCLLQYDQAESAKWAAEEAHLARLNAEDHHRRMEREARRSDAQRAHRGTSSGPVGRPPVALPGGDAFSWILLLGVAVVVGIGALLALVTMIAAAIVQLVKVVVVVGIVAMVGMLVLKNYRAPHR